MVPSEVVKVPYAKVVRHMDRNEDGVVDRSDFRCRRHGDNDRGRDSDDNNFPEGGLSRKARLQANEAQGSVPHSIPCASLHRGLPMALVRGAGLRAGPFTQLPLSSLSLAKTVQPSPARGEG